MPETTSPTVEHPRILCVDDEPHVLDGLRRQLRSRFVVSTADSGTAGLATLGCEGPFAVIVSDMRMPGMDGATFLQRAREQAPNTVRILLTGHAEFDAAVAAVNQGHIFRFLTKPCPAEVLLPALAAAAARHRELATAREQHAQALVDLQAAERRQADVLANMSHELRTPLAIIFGYTDMLRDGVAGPLSAEQRRFLAELDARSRALLELLEQLMHAGGLADERAAVALTAVPLCELVRTLTATATDLPQSPALGVGWDTPAALTGTLVTDQGKVALVVRSLLSNACKFTNGGRVIVRVRPQHTTLVIEVCDTGIGIAQQDLAVVFDLLRQGDGSSTRRYEGLGLYIAQQYVHRLGGTLEVESTPGMGSTFRVLLPGFSPSAACSSAGVAVSP